MKRISIEGTRERVSLTEFKNLVFPVARPDEQLLISARLVASQDAITNEIVARDKLKAQKLGLMQDLLTGKVPVSVDATEKETA